MTEGKKQLSPFGVFPPRRKGGGEKVLAILNLFFETCFSVSNYLRSKNEN